MGRGRPIHLPVKKTIRGSGGGLVRQLAPRAKKTNLRYERIRLARKILEEVPQIPPSLAGILGRKWAKEPLYLIEACIRRLKSRTKFGEELIELPQLVKKERQ